MRCRTSSRHRRCGAEQEEETLILGSAFRSAIWCAAVAEFVPVRGHAPNRWPSAAAYLRCAMQPTPNSPTTPSTAHPGVRIETVATEDPSVSIDAATVARFEVLVQRWRSETMFASSLLDGSWIIGNW